MPARPLRSRDAPRRVLLGPRRARQIDISVVSPWGTADPAIGARIERHPRPLPRAKHQLDARKRVTSIDPATKTAHLDDGAPCRTTCSSASRVHSVPDVVEASGLAVDGWIPVDKTDLSTSFPDVYAIGDVTSAPVPKAGIFAESAGRAVAEHLIVRLREEGMAKPYDGAGACFIEFGENKVGRVDVDFLTGPSVTAPYTEASLQGAEDKKEFAASRRKLWFES